MRLLVNTILHAIAHRFQVIADYWLNLLERGGVSLFNALARDETLNSTPWNVPPETKTALYRLVPNTFRCFEPFRRRPRVRRTDI